MPQFTAATIKDGNKMKRYFVIDWQTANKSKNRLEVVEMI